MKYSVMQAKIRQDRDFHSVYSKTVVDGNEKNLRGRFYGWRLEFARMPME